MIASFAFSQPGHAASMFGDMSATTLYPAPALAPFVTGLHYFESNGPTTLERILPGGQTHLMVNLHEDEFRLHEGTTVRRTRGAVFEGPASQARVIDTALQRSLICVDFTLGGATAFVDMPVSETRDSLVELDQLWGRDGATLRERLLEMRTPETKLRLLSELLGRHFNRREPDPAIHPAAALIERGVPIGEIAKRIGVLSKTLNRHFRAAVGLTPKRYARVRRLQRVLCSISGAHDVDWCETAAEHGYADQAHLVHDFRELTGMTPTAYRPRPIEERNHVPVESA
jgi:AraC-like DNA-binding protein